MFDHCKSRKRVKREISILNYFERNETSSESLEKIDQDHETFLSLQLRSTEVECVITKLKSVE